MDQILSFLQDNASIRKFVTNSEWLFANNIKTYDFPAESPDINPTESMWKNHGYSSLCQQKKI